MSLDDISLDDFIITDSNGELTLEFYSENLDVYLHEKAEENNVDYTDLINSLLEDEQYSPYIIYLLIHKFNLNNQTKENIWVELMRQGYYQINDIFDVDSLDLSQEDYNQVMWSAASKGNEHIMELMLENGANVNSVELVNNDTALTLATEEGHINIIRLLLDHGADVNHYNNYGDTALIIATFKGYNDIVQLLFIQYS